MKKTISILAVVALMLGMMGVTAFARGGHCGGIRRQPGYELCSDDGCDLSGPHQHDGIWYCKQAGDCLNYGICQTEGCAQTGLHEHDGAYYRPDYGAGRGCARGWSR